MDLVFCEPHHFVVKNWLTLGLFSLWLCRFAGGMMQLPTKQRFPLGLQPPGQEAHISTIA